MRIKLIKTNSIIILLLAALIVYSSINCRDCQSPEPERITYLITPFNINALSYDDAPYSGNIALSLDYPFEKDEQGIILFNYKEKKYYHPVQLAQWILQYLNAYRITNNYDYIKRSNLFADKLIEISTLSNNALYFPYSFTFSLHGGDILYSPWYSGMAQGQTLSAFVRLYKMTNEKKYVEIAEQIFTSFNNFKVSSNPWTVMTDSANYYWIEEYPLEIPDHTLNGFIFGIYGLYDYYQLTNNELCKELLQAGITTIYHYIDQFRNPGGISYYCLKHKHIPEASYHQVHIDQLNMLFKMTGENYFKEMADLFAKEHP